LGTNMALKISQPANGKHGFTLMELLVTVGILAILALSVFLVLDPMTQLKKAHDTKRKTDLRKLQTALEDYYNDKNSYPGDLRELAPDYLAAIPIDPSTGAMYDYSPQDSQGYRIYVELAYDQDPEVEAVGCGSGCGPDGGTPEGICTYNYGVSSSNLDLESCEGCSWGCQSGGGGECNSLIKECYVCPRWFCSPACEGKCSDPAYHCTFLGGEGC